MTDRTPATAPAIWTGLEPLEPRCLLSHATTTHDPVPHAGPATPLVHRKAKRRPRAAAAAKLTIKDATIVEGNPGQVRQMTFTVVRKGDLSGTAQVRFSAVKLFATGLRNATPNVDFNAKSGKISFAPGEKTKTIQVGILGDNIDEADEQFQVTLSKPKRATLQRSTATGTIIDNDDGKTVDLTISNDNFTPDESASYPPTLLPVQLTISNSGNADSGITAVQFQLINIDGGTINSTADVGAFILIPNVPAASSINVDFVLDFNRAFIFNDRWDVYAKVLMEDDDPTNNARRLGDIQITLPA